MEVSNAPNIPTKRLNTVAGHPYRWPMLLPEGWATLVYGEHDATYAHYMGMRVLCSATIEADGKPWLHVSCSFEDRTPYYQELAAVKKLFIGDFLTAYQIFPPADKHVNIHPHCLHLWACLDGPVTVDFTRGNGQI